jgi:hypothetical protein
MLLELHNLILNVLYKQYNKIEFWHWIVVPKLGCGLQLLNQKQGRRAVPVSSLYILSCVWFRQKRWDEYSSTDN